MKTYYEKRGRRYYPVSYHDSDALDALPVGHYLISVTHGCMSRRPVEPATAGVLGAAHAARYAMIDAMRARATVVIDARRYEDPDRAKRAWAAWCDVMGDDVPLMCEGVSMSDVVQAGIDVLTDAARSDRNGEVER